MLNISTSNKYIYIYIYIYINIYSQYPHAISTLYATRVACVVACSRAIESDAACVVACSRAIESDAACTTCVVARATLCVSGRHVFVCSAQCQHSHHAAPMLLFLRGNSHTRGNIWKFSVDGLQSCRPEDVYPHSTVQWHRPSHHGSNCTHGGLTCGRAEALS